MSFPKLVDMALPAALLTACWHLSAAAQQAYPEKPVRVVVPFPAGGAADIVARQVTTRLSKVIGQQIVIDNRGGAGGAIGADNIARAQADGYSLLFASSSVLSINPHLGAKTAYDVLRSFAPIVRIGDAPNVMTVHPSVPVDSVKAFIALAKAKPGELAYASNGTGTLSHLTGELFSQRTGVRMLHVPYKGGAPAVIDTVAGNVSVLFAAYPTVASQVRAGRLKALAVTSARRIAIAPQLPTVAETVKGFESSQWWGLYAPAGVPPAVVQKLNAAANQVLSSNEIGKVLAADGAVPAGGTPAALAAFHKADYDKWGAVMAKAGIGKK